MMKRDVIPFIYTIRDDDSMAVEQMAVNGSLRRVRYLANSLPAIRRMRKKLWGSSEPLCDAGLSNDSYTEALDKVWRWVRDSPEVKRYEKARVTEVGSDGAEVSLGHYERVVKPIEFPARIEGDIFKTILPTRRNAYALSDAVYTLLYRLIEPGKAAWWQPTGLAIYLTTGRFDRTALPRWSIREMEMRNLRGVVGAYMDIHVHDAASVSPTDVADIYRNGRQFITEKSDNSNFGISAGRPEEYSSEVLAHLELELILAEADKRFSEGESVQPADWSYRPKPKALAEAWRQKAHIYGIDADKIPSKQAISNFQSRVGRGLYESIFKDMWLPSDNERATEEAERNDRAVREAFNRKSNI